MIDQDEPKWLGLHDDNIEWREIAMHETVSMKPCNFGSQRAQQRIPVIDRSSERGAAKRPMATNPREKSATYDSCGFYPF